MLTKFATTSCSISILLNKVMKLASNSFFHAVLLKKVIRLLNEHITVFYNKPSFQNNKGDDSSVWTLFDFSSTTPLFLVISKETKNMIFSYRQALQKSDETMQITP